MEIDNKPTGHLDTLSLDIKILPVQDMLPACKNSSYNIYFLAQIWDHGLWMKLLMILGNERNPNGDQSNIEYKTKHN